MQTSPDAELTADAGRRLIAAGRHDEGLALLDRLLAADPADAEAAQLKAAGLYLVHRPTEAVAAFKVALSLDPNSAATYQNMVMALIDVGDYEAAVAAGLRAVELAPTAMGARRNLNLALCKAGRFEEALATALGDCALEPNNPVPYVQAGHALSKLDRPAEAEPYLRRAVELDADQHEAQYNLGVVLQDLGRDEEAMAAYRRTLALDPAHRGARLNLGVLLRNARRLEDAWAVWKASPESPADWPELDYNMGCAHLIAGDWPAGWAGYERRFEALPPGPVTTPSEAPPWTGAPAPGRTLLVVHEQGLGDTLQFVRLLADAAARVGRLVFVAQAPLVGLLSGLPLFQPGTDGAPARATLMAQGENPPPHDLRISLLSLPHVLGLTPGSLKASVPYLFPEEGRVRRWAERLGARGRGPMRIGIAWQGNPRASVDRGRSIPLAAFAPLGRFGEAVSLMALQKGEGAEQPAPAGLAVERLPADFDEGPHAFLDSAAIVSQIDLVITTDTSIAHLAGALGRPVWLLLRSVPDWRWGLEGLLTPWYPTMRLFRQASPGDWGGVMAAVAAELQALVELRRPLSPEESDSGEALYLEAARLSTDRRFAEAADIYRRLATRYPNNGRILNFFAMTRLEAGGRDRATATAVLPAALRSVALAPRESDLWSNLAVALDHAGHKADGTRALAQALVISPEHLPSQVAMANREITAGDHAAAVRRMDQVLAADPDAAHALSVKASALMQLGEPAKAEQALRRIMQRDQSNPRYLVQWGAALNAVKDYKGAVRAWERAASLDPRNADALSNLGVDERNRGELGLALHLQRSAVAIDPNHAEAHCNLGIAAMEAGRDDEAIAAFRRAIAIRPDYADAHMSLGMALLNQGNFADGLPEYEWRLRIDKLGLAANRPRLTEWQGEDPAGKSFLLMAEQGFGDAFQFVRYAAVLKARGAARVIVGCRERVAALLGRAAGVDGVVRTGERVPPVDYFAFIMSLPYRSGTTADTIPAYERYITAPPDRVTAWATHLAQKPGFRVGLVWQGNTDPQVDRGRSFPLLAMEPLARVPGVRLIALQKGPGEEQVAALAGRFPVETLGSGFDAGPDAFVDTAAVIANLDLVVTSDTAVAHLAGALGRPVWLVLREFAEWRWLRGRDDSPWYPLTRLFRRVPGEVEAAPFAGVFERLAVALGRLVAGKRDELYGVLAPQHVVSILNPDPMTRQRAAHQLHGRGQLAAARAAYASILIDNPDWPDSVHMLGALALSEYNYQRGVVLLRQAEALGVRTVDFRTNYSIALRHTSNAAKAEQLMREVMAETPTAEAAMTLGHIIRDDGRFEESLEHYRRAIALKPEMSKAHRGLGNALKDLNRTDEALAAFAVARELTPNDPELLLDEAHALLLAGDYRKGFAQYEIRWQAMEMLPRHFSVPRWKGEDYAGKTLLVHGEQGIGDQVQFSRFMAPAAARGGRMVVEIRGALLDLMRRVDFGGTEVEFVEQGRRLPPHDLEVPMMTLPVLFGTDVDSVPPPLDFRIDKGRIAAWRQSLGGEGAIRVGLVWQGNPNARADVGRSPPLEALEPLFQVPGLHFVSLQMRDGLDQIKAFRYGDRIEVLGERLAGFSETAAAMSALDVIISSCTSSAHLAGSLGRPTFVMLKANADWRWLVGRDSSPWYPSVRLFRQTTYGDWGPVARAIAEALARIAGAP